jgi:ATP-dependent Clp protease ATP-binding subunit ClpA
MGVLSLGVKAVWLVAREEAKAAGSGQIEPEHFLAGFTKLPTIVARQLAKGSPREPEVLAALQAEVSLVHQVLRQAGADPDRLRRRLRAVYPTGDQGVSSSGPLRRSQRSRQAFQRAAEIAVEQGTGKLVCAYLFLGILEELSTSAGGGTTGRFLLEEEVGKLEDFIQRARQQLLGSQAYALGPPPLTLPMERDLTAKAREGTVSRIIGRQKELARLVRMLSQKDHLPVLILGECGVGKSALVAELARRIAFGRLPGSVPIGRVVLLDLREFVTGFSSPEARVRAFHQWSSELNRDGQTLAVLEGLDALLIPEEVGRNFPVGSEVASCLAKRSIPCLALATPEEFWHLRHELPALASQFAIVVIPELSVAESRKVLAKSRRRLEEQYSVEIPDDILKKTVDFSVWFLPDRYLPAKALWLLEEACKWLSGKGRQGTRGEHPPEQEECPPPVVREEILAEVLSEKVGEEPARILLLARGPSYREIRKLNKAWADSAGVTRKSIRVIRRKLLLAASKLAPDSRPLAVFLLRGSARGVARRVARQLAKRLFGKRNFLVHLDFSSMAAMEDCNDFFAHRLDGLRWNWGIELVEQLRRHPFAVFLLDKWDECKDGLSRHLWELLREGCITDSLGRLGDARRVIFLLSYDLPETSLCRAEPSGLVQGFRGRDSFKGLYVPPLLGEVFSAVDGVVELKPISLARLTELVRRKVDWLTWKVRSLYGVLINVSDSAVRVLTKWILREGGIRVFRQVLERKLLVPLAAFLVKSGNMKWASVEVTAKAGKIRIRPRRIFRPEEPVVPRCCECHKLVPEDCIQSWAWIGNLFLCPECRVRLENFAHDQSPMVP